jgi:crotonobetainyl-CoA:carnitine CoA-transferase CaiB-like acyl-CoA transferase
MNGNRTAMPAQLRHPGADHIKILEKLGYDAAAIAQMQENGIVA